MAGLSEQPMAAGDVSTNGVAASREHVAKGQTRAYGRFAFGRTPVTNVFILAIGSLILASLVSSQASGAIKAILFGFGLLAIPFLVLVVRSWLARRSGIKNE